MKFIKAPGVNIKIEEVVSIYCDKNRAYLVPDSEDKYLYEFYNLKSKLKYADERYENVLKGLLYYKNIIKNSRGA